MYVDDLLIFDLTDNKISTVIQDLKSVFDLEDMGRVTDFLGVNVSVTASEIKLTQPQLIKSIVDDLRLLSNKSFPQTPSLTSRILQRNPDESPHNPQHFDYRSLIGKLNYLEKTTRPDISYASHQCARHSAAPKSSHSAAVIHLAKYLQGTSSV